MKAKLRCRQGRMGELLISLEAEGRRIPIGSVPSWESQETVLRYIREVNGLIAEPGQVRVHGEADRLAWK